MTESYVIGVLGGDGIGPEVTRMAHTHAAKAAGALRMQVPE
jgi:isocitrate/isopropylmalate dehydrogenase